MDITTWLLIAILAVVVLSILMRGGRETEARVIAIDRNLNLILDNLGIEANEGLDPQIADLLRTGQKIAAIKLPSSCTAPRPVPG